RREARHDPATADGAGGGRGAGHLSQQALRTAGQRRHRLDPYRWITAHPAHRPRGIHLQAAHRKDRRLMSGTNRSYTPRLRDGVIKRGTTWSTVIRVKDPETGASKPRGVGGFATEEDAKAARVEARVQARHGEYI